MEGLLKRCFKETKGAIIMGFFGKLFLGFLIVVVIVAFVGFLMTLRAKKRGEAEKPTDPTENVADLNDRFNRARYMDKDSK